MKPFMFDTQFDSDLEREIKRRKAEEEARRKAEEEKANEPPPPPTFSEEELQQAQAEAWEQGAEAGRAEAFGSIEQQMAMAMEAASQQMAELSRHHKDVVAGMNEDAARLAYAIASRICPAMAEQGLLDEVQAFARACLERVRDETRVLVRVSDTMLDQMQPIFEDMARKTGFDGQLTVIGDTGLTEGDCRLEWAGGGADRLTSDTWKQIDGMVRHFLGGDLAIPDPETGEDQPEPAPAEAD